MSGVRPVVTCSLLVEARVHAKLAVITLGKSVLHRLIHLKGLFVKSTHSSIVMVMLSGLIAYQAGAGDDKALDAFVKLEDEMRSAVLDYHDAIEEIRKGQRAGTVIPKDKLPPDGRLEVLAKMDKLVAHAGGHAGSIAVQTFLWALEIEPPPMMRRFATLVKDFPDEPSLVEALEYAPYMASQEAYDKKWADLLGALASSSAKRDVRQRAALAQGKVLLQAGKLADAKSVLSSLAAKDADAEVAEEAKGFLFEIEFLQVGMPAPHFETKTLDGQTLTLRQLRGNVVLLDFWASWCASCIAEIPNLRGAVSQFTGQPVEFVTISLDDDRQAALRTIVRLRAPGIHTWDAAGSENPIAKLYNVHSLPTWYLVDKNGIIRARDPHGEKLVPAIKAALQPQPKTSG